jgi:hypothetical protein
MRKILDIHVERTAGEDGSVLYRPAQRSAQGTAEILNLLACALDLEGALPTSGTVNFRSDLVSRNVVRKRIFTGT